MPILTVKRGNDTVVIMAIETDLANVQRIGTANIPFDVENGHVYTCRNARCDALKCGSIADCQCARILGLYSQSDGKSHGQHSRRVNSNDLFSAS